MNSDLRYSRIVATAKSSQAVVEDVLSRLSPGEVRTVTIYAGADAPEPERDSMMALVTRRFPGASVELQAGDQALYPYILAVE